MLVKYPTISVLIPTLNAARVLEGCLQSIINQDYPSQRIEIIIADGGSTDETLDIVKKLEIKVVNNPLKTGEAGKAVALRHASGELAALIDSDNILPDKEWFKKMIEPFQDPEILGSEPWEFTYRKSDSLVNRYCALIGANDPYCYFVGNYDKKSVLSGKWTGLKVWEEDKGDFIKVKIAGKILPTIGANGTIWRAEVLKKAVGQGDYLFDTDIPYILASKKPFYFAKVKVGIAHLYCRSFSDFSRKQKRRAKDFFYLEKSKKRFGTFQKQIFGQLYFIFSVLLVFPLIYQTIRGYFKKPDKAWFFHPIACIITLWIYTTETILAKFRISQMSREKWRQ
jgi:glycosyltransferase involved in cell wall biosynthesis